MRGIFSLVIFILMLAGAWAMHWEPTNKIDWWISLPTNTTAHKAFQLVDDKPLYYEIAPLSANCTLNGVSINFVGDPVQKPESSYNFTIAVDTSFIKQLGYFHCDIRVYNLYTNESSEFVVTLYVDSYWCTINPNLCKKNQRCNQETHYCECLPNWYGFDCSTFCQPNATCTGNGSCNSHGYCKCYNGHAGSDCSKLCDDSKDCSGHGSCTGYGCDCDKGYYGDHCDKKCDPCEHGHCNSVTGKCDKCYPEYYGSACQYTCSDCLTHGGGCTNTTQCLCPGLKYGDLCENDRTILVVSTSIGGGLLLILVTFCLTKWKYAKNSPEEQGYQPVVVN